MAASQRRLVITFLLFSLVFPQTVLTQAQQPAKAEKSAVAGPDLNLLRERVTQFWSLLRQGRRFEAIPAASSGAIPPVPQYTTTAGSPGNGLTATGTVAAGGTYTVLISQLLNAAGIASPFEGHVITVCNFTHGHGLYVLGNFSGFTQGGTAQVIPNTTLVSRAGVIGGAAGGEILGQ